MDVCNIVVGPIPSSLGLMSSIVSIDLSQNKFGGTFDVQIYGVC